MKLFHLLFNLLLVSPACAVNILGLDSSTLKNPMQGRCVFQVEPTKISLNTGIELTYSPQGIGARNIVLHGVDLLKKSEIEKLVKKPGISMTIAKEVNLSANSINTSTALIAGQTIEMTANEHNFNTGCMLLVEEYVEICSKASEQYLKTIKVYPAKELNVKDALANKVPNGFYTESLYPMIFADNFNLSFPADKSKLKIIGCRKVEITVDFDKITS